MGSLPILEVDRVCSCLAEELLATHYKGHEIESCQKENVYFPVDHDH